MVDDYIVMISRGRSVFQGTVEELKEKNLYTHKIMIKKIPIKEHINLEDRKIIYTDGKDEVIERVGKK